MHLEDVYKMVAKKIRDNIPVLMVIFVTIIQVRIVHLMNHRVFIFLYPAMFLGIIIGPLKSSIAAVILSSLSLCYLFLEPLGSFEVHSPTDILAVIFYLTSGLCLIYVSYKQNKIKMLQTKVHLEQFENLADSMPQLAWMAKADGYIFWYNQQWYKYTGTTPQEMEGWGWQSVHHSDTLPEVMHTWPKSIQSGKPFEMEFPLRGANGKYKWFLTRALPIRNDRGEIIRWFGTNTDIDSQRNERIELNRAIKTRDEFITLASHEFKTPITSLKLQTQIFQRQIDLENGKGPSLEKQFHFLKVNSSQIDRLNLLVDELLDVSRMDEGKLTYDFTKINLTSLINELTDRFRDEFLAHDCQVTVRANSSEQYVLGDAFRLEQVFINVFNNAMKYGYGNPVNIYIGSSESAAEVIVEDHGIGIEEDAIPHIFNRFERAVSHKNISGLGLGLYIAREMLKAQNGSIRVESEIGKGSKFFITLPLYSTANINNAY